MAYRKVIRLNPFLRFLMYVGALFLILVGTIAANALSNQGEYLVISVIVVPIFLLAICMFIYNYRLRIVLTESYLERTQFRLIRIPLEEITSLDIKRDGTAIVSSERATINIDSSFVGGRNMISQLDLILSGNENVTVKRAKLSDIEEELCRYEWDESSLGYLYESRPMEQAKRLMLQRKEHERLARVPYDLLLNMCTDGYEYSYRRFEHGEFYEVNLNFLEREEEYIHVGVEIEPYGFYHKGGDIIIYRDGRVDM